MEEPSRIPILLTSSAVAHDSAVVLTDTQTRIELTLAGIGRWCTIAPDAPIVLCDGSGHDFAAQVATLYPQARVECLHFQYDTEGVRRQGRGFGEGEIVRYALAHSRHIGAAGAFVKCSAKLWVRNYAACMRAWNGRVLCHGIFLRVFEPWHKTHWHHVDTRFYAASVDTYRRYLLDAHHRIAGPLGLEECFQAVLLDNAQALQGVLMRTPPLIEGVGGGVGRAYRTRTHRVYKDRLRLWLVRQNPRFSQWFSSTIAAHG